MLGHVTCQDRMSSEAAGTLEGHRKGRVPRALRLKQLLDVAEELFVTEGYDRTTIEEICRLAGVSRPIVYSLVGNKATLYLACVRRARADLERSMAVAAGSSEDPQEQLTRGSEAYFELLEKDPRRWELFFGRTGLVGELADELARERFRTVSTIAAVLARYAPDVDPALIEGYASLISGAGEQLGRWWMTRPGIPRERIVAMNADFVWRGVRHLREPGD